MKPCFLRKTEIELADGKTYIFRALPFSEETINFVKKYEKISEDPAEALKLLIQTIKISLSYDQEITTIDDLFDSGAIPMPTADDPLVDKIMQAMISLG